MPSWFVPIQNPEPGNSHGSTRGRGVVPTPTVNCVPCCYAYRCVPEFQPQKTKCRCRPDGVILFGNFVRREAHAACELGSESEWIGLRSLLGRNASAFAEALIPLVGRANRMRFARPIELPLTGRSERFSNFGRTAKPKFGLNIRPNERILLRSILAASSRALTLMIPWPIRVRPSSPTSTVTGVCVSAAIWAAPGA